MSEVESGGGEQPLHSKGFPSATVVVCTRQRPALLETALASIWADVQTVPGAEVLVVEQGEPQATQLCSRRAFDVRVISDEGRGASRARNIAAREATGEVLLFTDDDCEVPRGWVSAHLAALSDPRTVASFGPVTGMSPLGAARTGEAVSATETCPWLVGHSANMAIRRDVLVAMGGFDERLGAGVRSRGGEDADLIIRLLRSGAGVSSDVGPAVRHAAWRADREHRRTLIGYERGAGAWIGKTVRHSKKAAVPYLRSRLRYLARRVQDDVAVRRDPVGAGRAVFAFFYGFTLGLRMKSQESCR